MTGTAYYGKCKHIGKGEGAEYKNLIQARLLSQAQRSSHSASLWTLKCSPFSCQPNHQNLHSCSFRMLVVATEEAN